VCIGIPTMSTQQKQPKPILKQNRVHKPRSGLLWDELNIEETSKERGTRMKIDEPDTPYNYDYVSSSSEEEDPQPKPVQQAENVVSSNWDAINNKLETAQKKQEHGLDLVAGVEEEKKKKEDFMQKRKAHYNEGKKWKEALDHQKRTVIDKKEKVKPEKDEENEQDDGKDDGKDSVSSEPENKRQKT